MENPHSASIGATESGLAARAVPIALAVLLGLFVIAGAGFAQIDALHNAAHDYRHSMGFPCH